MNKQTQKELLDIVKSNYEAVADEFNETRKKYLWPELLNLAETVKDGDKILDAGCGNGRLLKAMQDKKIDYLGVDNSENLIAKAWEEFADEDIKAKYEFRNGNILELANFPELNFDYIFSIAVLHHFPGTDLRVQALKQLKNKISQNGKIIITAWNLWSQPKYRTLIIKFFLLKLIGKNKMDMGDILFDWKNTKGEIKSRRYYHAFTKRELKKTIYKAGFKIEKIYKDKYNYYLILKK
jgi:2-polyprenyl-3-methyl-5-hydroxy-6-metoxy-1,4-benzoquinol methylase